MGLSPTSQEALYVERIIDAAFELCALSHIVYPNLDAYMYVFGNTRNGMLYFHLRKVPSSSLYIASTGNRVACHGYLVLGNAAHSSAFRSGACVALRLKVCQSCEWPIRGVRGRLCAHQT